MEEEEEISLDEFQQNIQNKYDYKKYIEQESIEIDSDSNDWYKHVKLINYFRGRISSF